MTYDEEIQMLKGMIARDREKALSSKDEAWKLLIKCGLRTEEEREKYEKKQSRKKTKK